LLISSSLVKIRLHTENQLPRLPGSALKVPVGWGGGVGSYPLLSQAPTHVEVELGCDNKELLASKLWFWCPDQSSATNSTYASNFRKSKIYKGKLAADFFGGLPKINLGTWNALVVFLKDRNGHILKVRKSWNLLNKRYLEHLKKLGGGGWFTDDFSVLLWSKT
jgi:hypothetical protein